MASWWRPTSLRAFPTFAVVAAIAQALSLHEVTIQKVESQGGAEEDEDDEKPRARTELLVDPCTRQDRQDDHARELKTAARRLFSARHSARNLDFVKFFASESGDLWSTLRVTVVT